MGRLLARRHRADNGVGRGVALAALSIELMCVKVAPRTCRLRWLHRDLPGSKSEGKSDMACIRNARVALAACRARLQRLLILVVCILPAGVLAPHAWGQSAETGREKVTLEGSQTDMQFLAGRSVQVRAKVADDVFATGRDVTFENATVKNAVIAGYDVEQRGGTAADMIAAAANLKVAGSIEDDLVAVARSLRISSGGTVGGDARLAAETIDMEGHIGGSMRAAARRVTISGEIVGKADLLAERIVIAAGADIAGDLIYRSKAEPEIADGATIRGEIRRVEIDMPDLRALARAILGIGLLILLSWAIAMLVLIAIIQLAFPEFISEAAGQLQAHPWSNLGRGVVVYLVVAVLAGVLFASIVGVPIGGALLMAMAVMWLLGLVTVSCCIGLFIRRTLRGAGDIRTAGRIGWALAGAIILGLVALVPFVGVLVSGLAVASGLGAAAAEVWSRLRTA
jgi:cytoskeletal protein CcmA (bactofilin family)